MTDVRTLAVTGLVPPQLGEVRIRERWPSVAAHPALATLGQKLTRTIILAPLAWLLMAGAFFGKLLPFIGWRYSLTNRRVMIRRGWSCAIEQEVALADIDEVRLVTDDNSDFFRAANLEIVNKGQVVMTLRGLPEPETFRQAILNTRNAWVADKVKTLPFISASAGKK